MPPLKFKKFLKETAANPFAAIALTLLVISLLLFIILALSFGWMSRLGELMGYLGDIFSEPGKAEHLTIILVTVALLMFALVTLIVAVTHKRYTLMVGPISLIFASLLFALVLKLIMLMADETIGSNKAPALIIAAGIPTILSLICGLISVALSLSEIYGPIRKSQVELEEEQAFAIKAIVEGLTDKSRLPVSSIVFPSLTVIDNKYAPKENEEETPKEEWDEDYTIEEILVRFRNYLAKEEKLYFSLDNLRSFLAGMAASRLIILEGMSGTGKSSLARFFSEFIQEPPYFEAVQATWRDRTALVGYFNDFSHTYGETEFLKRLYEYNYKPGHINIMVLDELNISRVEYYFADFLSIMEYPMKDWKLRVMEYPIGFEGPVKLEDGVLQIPEGTYFVGTANKDDSTHTITDKVYDRAIVLSFDLRNDPFEVEGEAGKIKLSYTRLNKLFEDAIANPNNGLSPQQIEKFNKIADFTYETFELTFGNRIMNQIESMVPIYAVSGGNKEDALDFMFARKVIYKLKGRYEDYIKDGLIDLSRLIEKTYGKGNFKMTQDAIKSLLRKL